ncbi:histone H5-like [Xenia sp. Carnegie-2017]|uniref:histone H5-like n=1 Tax=Xenia sp. Carnegie-2017 TaxID=2897299 RepID=UPI001F044254|nr:histone H5-like [Xenia sp. Carnegie-2017]
MSAEKKKAKPAEHPKYLEMIVEAIKSLKERGGSSRQAIEKYIRAHYKIGDSGSVHVKLALKKGVLSGALSQPKGTGASGSFKIAKPVAAPKKPTKEVKPKPSTKKASTPAKKKAAKSPKKKTPAKKPKKAAAKKTTSTKKPSPKKNKKPAGKKPTKKTKPATKKSPAKKPAKKTSKK